MEEDCRRGACLYATSADAVRDLALEALRPRPDSYVIEYTLTDLISQTAVSKWLGSAT